MELKSISSLFKEKNEQLHHYTDNHFLNLCILYIINIQIKLIVVIYLLNSIIMLINDFFYSQNTFNKSILSYHLITQLNHSLSALLPNILIATSNEKNAPALTKTARISVTPNPLQKVFGPPSFHRWQNTSRKFLYLLFYRLSVCIKVFM